MNRFPVYVSNSLVITLEPNNEGLLFLHCNVKVKWNKKIKTEFLTALEDIKKAVLMLKHRYIFVAAHIDDAKLHKFARMFGFINTRKRVGDLLFFYTRTEVE